MQISLLTGKPVSQAPIQDEPNQRRSIRFNDDEVRITAAETITTNPEPERS